MNQTFLHIGLEKTGTTSIQLLLSQSIDSLAAGSVFVPKSVNLGNNFHLAIASYAKFRADGLTRQLCINSQAQLDSFREKSLRALSDEYQRSKANKVVLSSEHFQSRLTSVADIQLLKQQLEQAGLSNFVVVLYLRDPLKITMSHHGMAIKKGVHVTDDFYHPEHPRVSQILNFRKTIAEWQQVFGRDALRLRLYPEGKPSNALIQDFLQVTEIAASLTATSALERKNVNLSASALQALNEVNAKSDIVRKLAADRWLFNQLERKFPGSGLAPTQQQIELFRSYFAEEHAQIARDWFDRDYLFATLWKQPAAEVTQVETAKAVQRLIKISLWRYRLKKLLKK